MLQIEKIHKKYITGDLVQTALNDVSLNLRDNELVAILGPSGSGKTTLLNIIGGLDHYDSGDLIINGISTKRYTDRDWDSYRNHTIGFVFQSYNLIPHQTVLSNVELALTISGVSKSERKKRAIEALEKVGLGNQLHKKPNQMSGGQMQRVAIARALINAPDILLADEPTGALDSETSVQVMELLKEVAKDRLVVMVTHNPELAEEYATRIVKVRDGKIIDDSNPYQVDASQLGQARHENMGKSSMSFSTSLSLSFNNLKSKKGRTLLTAFAGSIGIIGIALILSISNGVNTYISDIQKSTMSSYPISIQSQSIDLSSIMSSGQENMKKLKSGEVDHDLDAVYSNGTELEMASKMTTSITENNLTEFKKYLDDTENEIHQYIGENGIVYSYDTKFDVYTYDSEDTLVNTDGSTLEGSQSSASVSSPMMAAMSSSSSNHFEELLPGTEDELISSTITDSYDVLYGSWPSKYNELVIVLNHNNEISATTLYKLGLLPSSEYNELISKIEDGETVTLDTQKLSYEDIIAQTFYMIPSCDLYVENDNGTFDYIGDDNSEIKNLLEDAVELKVVGIIRPKEDTETVLISNTVGYTKALTDYIIDYTNNSEV
ncbi:ATP-binding cassette domain-containing protein, partial [Turicibacter sanguinis]|nr:ATP-binding cassette domain-containing protein [Turicibacter sanguinis]